MKTTGRALIAVSVMSLTLLAELSDREPDFEAIGTASESMSTAGQTIDSRIEENCPRPPLISTRARRSSR